MKILITGSEGFVGRAFRRAIKDTEFKRKYFGDEMLVLTPIDIKNEGKHHPYTDCRDLFKKSNEVFDLVIHLAAIVGGRINIERNPIAVATDLSIDAEMFNWAVRTKQPRVVYFSSSAAYPLGYQTSTERRHLQERYIDFNYIEKPDMTYGWAKLTGEMLAEYARKQGVNVHVFRPFSGYGEDQDLDYPFPSFIQRIKDKVPEFEIWGDGKQVRDFIHVDDIVEAVMKAVELDIQEPINLGSGVGTSFNQLAEMMMEISGHKVPIIHKLDKPVGVQYRVSDNTKMLEFYKPKVSLQEGIKRALHD